MATHAGREGDARATRLLVILVSVDLLLIALHVLRHGYISLPRPFSLQKQFGAGESFQYVKEFAALAMLVWLATRGGQRGFWPWAALYGAFLGDDSLKWHEKSGDLLGGLFGTERIHGVRPQDLGELTFCAVVGSAFLAWIGYAYLRGDGAFRRACRRLMALTGVLALFGVIFDPIHTVLVQRAGEGKLLAGVVEDGGEMLAMSFIVWYVFRLYQRARSSPTPGPSGPPAARDLTA